MIAGRRPFLLLLNGNIHTMDADQPRATALAWTVAPGASWLSATMARFARSRAR